jgi:hypothetical protein
MSSAAKSARAKEYHSTQEAPATGRSVLAVSAVEDGNAASPPAYVGDIRALRIWFASAALLVFLHITSLLGVIFR